MGKPEPRVGALSFYEELKAEHTDPSAVVKQCVPPPLRGPVARAHAPHRRAAETAERPGGLVPIYLAIQGSSLKPPGPDIREARARAAQAAAPRADAAAPPVSRRAFCGG